MSRAPAIEARGWGWRYPGRRAWALRGVDLRVEAGERVLLVGPSGGGKSTLLAGIAGLLDRAGGGDAIGELLVDGREAGAARDRVGLVLQDPESQLVMARAGDDVAFGLENRCVPTDAIWPRVDAALDRVGFRYGRDRRTAALSGGEKQRLAIAGTIAMGPSMLLLDEPTANLDPDGAAAVRGVIARLAAEGAATIVLVEHRTEEVVDLVDRVVVLEPGGGVAADGTPGEVFGGHGQRLAQAGVWVPGVALPSVRRPDPAPRGPLVVAEAAGFRYPGSSADAVSAASLELRSGEALALVGPNGSGKSTLAMLLAGLLRPTSGEVSGAGALAEDSVGTAVAGWNARRLVRSIGTVFQEPEHQFVRGRVDEELLLGPARAGVSVVEAERRVRVLLERLHLSRLAVANPFTLSGGEKRRLSVATALATQPPVLILDEPTFGQDRRTWIELLELLDELRADGAAICIASHDEPFVSAIGDRSCRMSGGRLTPAAAAA